MKRSNKQDLDQGSPPEKGCLSDLYNALNDNDFLNNAPYGNQAPVLCIPGLGGSDRSTEVLRSYLELNGWTVYGWEGGRNTGPKSKNVDHLVSRLHEIYNEHNQKVSLVGHSLGGIYARELAKSHSDLVEKVITLGSPIGGMMNPHHVSPIARFMFTVFNATSFDLYYKLNKENGFKVMSEHVLMPPPVPTTSLYTRHDKVVNWKSCLNPDTPNSENIEICNISDKKDDEGEVGHSELNSHPLSLYIIAERLSEAHEDGVFIPFNKHSNKDVAKLIRDDQAHHGNEPLVPKIDQSQDLVSLFKNKKPGGP
jgi:esterase/lipase